MKKIEHFAPPFFFKIIWSFVLFVFGAPQFLKILTVRRLIYISIVFTIGILIYYVIFLLIKLKNYNAVLDNNKGLIEQKKTYENQINRLEIENNNLKMQNITIISTLPNDIMDTTMKRIKLINTLNGDKINDEK